jgi:hypothetical protein
MAIFTKEIPDTLLTEAILAYCHAYNYQELIDDGSGELVQNPESKINFTKRMDKEFTINLIKKYRVDALEEQRLITESQAETDCENIDVS